MEIRLLIGEKKASVVLRDLYGSGGEVLLMMKRT